jgi:Domain of unknown function (DUF4190)
VSNPPEQPFGGVEYPPAEQWRPPPDPYAPIDYPTGYPPVPPAYPPPAAGGYPGGYPGYPGVYPGYPAYPPDPYDPYRSFKPQGTNGKATASLVTSLAGLLLCGLPSIAGLILGIIAMRETKQSGQDGYGIALAGTIVGALATAVWLIYLVVILVYAGTYQPTYQAPVYGG